MKALLKQARLPDIRFHELHHAFPAMPHFREMDIKILSSMLGHCSAGFTLDTCTHISRDMQKGKTEKLGGFMETATAKPKPAA